MKMMLKWPNRFGKAASTVRQETWVRSRFVEKNKFECVLHVFASEFCYFCGSPVELSLEIWLARRIAFIFVFRQHFRIPSSDGMQFWARQPPPHFCIPSLDGIQKKTVSYPLHHYRIPIRSYHFARDFVEKTWRARTWASTRRGTYTKNDITNKSTALRDKQWTRNL